VKRLKYHHFTMRMNLEAQMWDLFEDRACPLCGGRLVRNHIRLARFDCPHCLKTLRPGFFPGHLWIRGFICCGAGLALAWHNGWTDSFVIFVVSFYVLPMMFLWDLTVYHFFLPKHFEPVASSFPVLDLSSK